ncbi:MAG: rhomboid family intramembrane serine protease, partial [Deltaproteobacteria bacterium]|nr:rhomboid family intramembrane serine protease [Deltaproteobacteria bacterium]
MIIIPLGHEESQVRRLPWVSFVIVAICTVVLLGTDMGSLQAPVTSVDYLLDASDYWRENPYLEPTPEILDVVGRDVSSGQREQYLELIRQDGYDMGAYLDPQELQRQQDHLDDLIAMANSNFAAEPTEVQSNPFTRWGLTPADPQAVNFITHIFMHGGWMHLIGNMFMLLIAGAAIEDRFGRPLFAAFFLLGGIAAGGIHMLANPESTMPMVGASGAVGAVFGAFLVRFTHSKIRFFYFYMWLIPFRIYKGTFAVRALVVAPLWFMSEALDAYIVRASGYSDGVAHWAHMGGFVFGIGGAFIVRQLKFEERYIDSAIEDKVTFFQANPVLEEAMGARSEGDLERAFGLLEAEVAKNPKDPDLALEFWITALSSQRAEEGLASMRTVIENSLREKDIDAAINYWREMNQVLPAGLIPAGTLMKMIPAQLEHGRSDLSSVMLRHAVDPDNTGLTPGIAIRIVDAALEVEPPAALTAARQLLHAPDLHESKLAKYREIVNKLEEQGVTEHPSVAEAFKREQKSRESLVDESGAIPMPDYPDEAEIQATAHTSVAMAGAGLGAGVGMGVGVGPGIATATSEPVTPPPLPQTPPPLPTTPPPLPVRELSADGVLVNGVDDSATQTEE